MDRKYIPDEVRNAKLLKGETVVKYGEGLMVASWKGKRKVMYLSTEYENVNVTISNKRNEERVKPLPIVKYNAFMKGVDRSDQVHAGLLPLRAENSKVVQEDVYSRTSNVSRECSLPLQRDLHPW